MKNLFPTLLFPILVVAGANAVSHASDSSPEAKLCEFESEEIRDRLITFSDELDFAEKLEKKLDIEKEKHGLDECIIEMERVSNKTANIIVRISYKTREHGFRKVRWDGRAVASYPAALFENDKWTVLDALAVVRSEQKPTLGGWEPDRETPVNGWFMPTNDLFKADYDIRNQFFAAREDHQ